MKMLLYNCKAVKRLPTQVRPFTPLLSLCWHAEPRNGTFGLRLCATAASETKTDAASELQALAARIVQDRDLASRLATSPLTAELLRSAGPPASEPASTIRGRLVSEVALPSGRQRRLYFMNNFLPFVGFGFCDNFIMILVGDLVDAKLGVAFGISTMAAAAIGNTFSDVVGIGASGFIETANAALGIPTSGLTSEQRADIRMRILKNTACALGITIGCVLGMAPLLFPARYRLWDSRDEVEQARATASAESKA